MRALEAVWNAVSVTLVNCENITLLLIDRFLVKNNLCEIKMSKNVVYALLTCFFFEGLG